MSSKRVGRRWLLLQAGSRNVLDFMRTVIDWCFLDCTLKHNFDVATHFTQVLAILIALFAITPLY